MDPTQCARTGLRMRKARGKPEQTQGQKGSGDACDPVAELESPVPAEETESQNGQ